MTWENVQMQAAESSAGTFRDYIQTLHVVPIVAIVESDGGTYRDYMYDGLEKVTLVKGLFFFKFSSTEGVDSVLRDGPWMIRGVLIFQNKLSPSLSLIVTKISTPMMLDSYTSSMCLVTWDRSSYARILIEIDVCNGFSDNLVMAVPNLNRPGYTKETILVKYEWKPPHCSTCLIYGHSVDDCQKAPKLVVNRVDKDKRGSFGANDDGFIEVKKKKSGGNNRGTKNFKPISVKPKTIDRLKVNQPTEEASPKTTPSADKKKISTTGNSSKKTSKTNESTSEEGQSSTLLVYKINMFKQQLLEGKCVLLDDEGKTLEKIDYTGDHDNEDEVKPIDNEMAIILAFGVGCGTNSLLEQ
ncbi:putative ribonuclease H-like domain-containing protein [Tanacetum coccineum]